MASRVALPVSTQEATDVLRPYHAMIVALSCLYADGVRELWKSNARGVPAETLGPGFSRSVFSSEYTFPVRRDRLTRDGQVQLFRTSVICIGTS